MYLFFWNFLELFWNFFLEFFGLFAFDSDHWTLCSLSRV
jgi:hypothetical protein